MGGHLGHLSLSQRDRFRVGDVFTWVECGEFCRDAEPCRSSLACPERTARRRAGGAWPGSAVPCL